MQVIRRPGGGWARNADGSQGQKLWHNVRGVRTLTAFGQQQLTDWYDLTIHIPAIEQELANDHHRHNDAARQTWYPVSEASLPGLMAQLQANNFDVRNATTIPLAVKGWILGPNGLRMATDQNGRWILDESSDRFWEYDDLSGRQWRMSVQHVENGRLQTDLDRPMNGAVFEFDDIPYKWFLDRERAFVEHDCVPLSLAHSLGETFEYVKRNLDRIARDLNQDPADGYTRKVVTTFLDWEGQGRGETIGYKVFVNGRIAAEKSPGRKQPFIQFAQKSSHLYLYEKKPGNNNFSGSKAEKLYLGLRQNERHFQGDMPNEIRCGPKHKSTFAPALWRLKRPKREAETYCLEKYTGLRAGFFICDDLREVRLSMLRQGKVPTVRLKHATSMASLKFTLGPKEFCCVREAAEGSETLALLAERLAKYQTKISYAGQSAPSFGFHALMQLLRRNRDVVKLEPGMCEWCGAPAQEVDHNPQLARNTEPSGTQQLCKDCHSQKTQQEALFDDGWRPLVSVLNSVTYEHFHQQPREHPFNLNAQQPRMTCCAEVDFCKHYRHVLMYPGYGWAVYGPCDSWVQNDNEAHWCWVDNGPAPEDIRDRVYIGPSWYCQPLVRAMLEYKEISRHHIKLGWRPTRILPEDTFERPMQLILDQLGEIGTEEAEKLSKTLPNSLIGYMISQDEPCEFRYSCSQDPGERPPCSIELPGFLVEEFGMHEWCQVVEQRSYDSLRPIHSQIMGIARLRMVQLAKLLMNTLGRRSLCQAKTDAWYVSCPPKCREKLRGLKLTYRDFGVPCDDPALKVTFGQPNFMRNVSDIRHNWHRPEVVTWKRHENWEHLKNWTLIGPAGTGKTFLLLKIAEEKRRQGKKVYMISFTNAVCCQLAEAVTVHKFLRLAYRGDLETPCTVIWDEVFYVNTYTLARMAPLRMLDIEWIFAGDHKQLQMPGHWRGQVCENKLFGSSYLPPDYVELTEPKRTIDPSFWAFQMRVRDATKEELPLIKAEAKKDSERRAPSK